MLVKTALLLLLFFITPYTAAHTNTKKAKIHLKYNLSAPSRVALCKFMNVAKAKTGYEI